MSGLEFMTLIFPYLPKSLSFSNFLLYTVAMLFLFVVPPFLTSVSNSSNDRQTKPNERLADLIKRPTFFV